ncbi:MAG: MFS transporter [Bacteroidales bacterium]|nr:MFS transporter [Bacteroidales bacterium]
MKQNQKTNFRWVMCALLFAATTINYLDRQVLSLTFEEFIKPEFHWTDAHYGTITAVFSLCYAIFMLFAGRLIDWLGTKKGYTWAIGVWSAGACLHAVCGLVTRYGTGLESSAALLQATGDTAVLVATVSLWAFLVARCVLAFGEAGNFPAAIKVTAEYFPKKDRAFATSVFNSGASIGALVAPLTIPPLAKHFGWEMAFVIIGSLGFVWAGCWVFLYDEPRRSRFVSKGELEYIESDKMADDAAFHPEEEVKKGVSIWKCFTYRQTWSLIAGKGLTDGVWWFFLFWTPSYLKAQFDINTSDPKGMMLIFTLYAIVMLSLLGGKLPTLIIRRTGWDPYRSRMLAMLLFAFFPLCVLLAQPLGQYSPWWPILLIGVGCAAHQSWSANIFSTTGDMFPKPWIATVTGIGGMAGGIGSFFIQKGAGNLFTYADEVQMHFLGYVGKSAGYEIAFIVCSVAYLLAWLIMKALVPKYRPVV